MTRTIKHIAPLLGILCCALFLAGCAVQTTTTSNQTQSDGRVVMTLTDAATNVGTVTSIQMTVDTVKIHSTDGGWVTAASPHKTYDLLALHATGSNALLADLALPPGKYGQVEIDVSHATVTDVNGTHDATMPSGVLRFDGEMNVVSNKTSTGSFDFVADNSLYTTEKGSYVFAPAIQYESRSDATVDLTNTDNVQFGGGTVEDKQYVAMNIDGVLDVHGKLPPFINVQTDGKIIGADYDMNENKTELELRILK